MSIESAVGEESVSEILSRIDDEYKSLVKQWTDDQKTLKSRMKDEEENFLDNVRYVGGVDISFPKDKNDLIHAVACLVVVQYPSLEVCYKESQIVHLDSIYVPGFLAFREVSPLVDLCASLKLENPDIFPQVIMVDGNGLLHTKRFGLACHLGVVLDMPTIGVAKKLFQVDNLEKNEHFNKDFQEQCQRKGDSLDLIGESGFLYGKAFRSTDKSSNPIYISQGNAISLRSCVQLVKESCLYRVPEPVRLADQHSREFLRTLDMNKHECDEKFVKLNDRFKLLTQRVESIKKSNIY